MGKRVDFAGSTLILASQRSVRRTDARAFRNVADPAKSASRHPLTRILPLAAPSSPLTIKF